MTTTELLATFANNELIKTLSMGDKFTASIITTILGMGITFSALIILLIIISWMNKVLNPTASKKTASAQTPAPKTPVASHDVAKAPQDDSEIVAAITTAIAMTLKTSTSNIVIKNIEKVTEQTPQWNRAGIIEQMNSRL